MLLSLRAHRALAQFHICCRLIRTARNRHLDLRSWLLTQRDAGNIGAARNQLPTNRYNHIAQPDASLLRGTLTGRIFGKTSHQNAALR